VRIKNKCIILKEGLALLEYVSTCYIKNILKKRENGAGLPHFVVGLCGYAPCFMLCSAASLGFTRALPHRRVRFPGLCMTWVWFEVQGEVGRFVVVGFLPFVSVLSAVAAVLLW